APYVATSVPVTAKHIQTLIENARVFKPDDGKQVKKIFYNNSSVILYSRDENWNTSIYYAKENSNFVKCKTQMKSQCECLSGHSIWEITIPDEAISHEFKFPRGINEDLYKKEHDKDTSWDGLSLKEIALRW